MKYQTITLNEKNITDFASSRNKLLASAKSEWVLFLDTDEELSDELKKELEKLKPGKRTGFIIKRKIIFLGTYIGEDEVLRLAKKDAGRWVRKVHETWNIKGKIGNLDNYIIHNTAKDMSTYVAKMNKYSDIHARENLKEGKRSDIIKIIFYPLAKLIQNLLAGRGFTFSMLQSFHSFLGWTKLWELQKKKQ